MNQTLIDAQRGAYGIDTATRIGDRDVAGPGAGERAVWCPCGCERVFSVPAQLMSVNNEGVVKDSFRPRRYCEDFGGFVVSGSTGCAYATLECLNRMNE